MQVSNVYGILGEEQLCTNIVMLSWVSDSLSEVHSWHAEHSGKPGLAGCPIDFLPLVVEWVFVLFSVLKENSWR